MRFRTTVVALAAAALARGAAAQEVDVRRATPATGVLEVHVPAGEVKLTGWNRSEVYVTGTLSREGDRVEVTPHGDRLVVRVQPVRGHGSRRADLEIRFPARKILQVHTGSADVQIESAAGPVHVNSASGNVTVEGQAAELTVHTRSGNLELSGGTGRLSVHTISGNVQVHGPVRGEAAVHTVSGDMQFDGPVGTLRAHSVSGSIQAERVGTAATVQSVSGDIEVAARTLVGQYSTVSGNIALAGAPATGAGLEVRSHSGEVELRLPRGTQADLAITSWSGQIGVTVPGAALVQGSSRERHLRLGRGGPRIELSTFSGNVRVSDR